MSVKGYIKCFDTGVLILLHQPHVIAVKIEVMLKSRYTYIRGPFQKSIHPADLPIFKLSRQHNNEYETRPLTYTEIAVPFYYLKVNGSE